MPDAQRDSDHSDDGLSYGKNFLSEVKSEDADAA